MQQCAMEFGSSGLVAGVDEAGRGPLAGPVFAAAVIFAPQRRPAGLRDSKILNEATRERLALEIRAQALCWSVAWADREEIDALNILRATMLAMRRALLGLAIGPNHILVDGNRCPDLGGCGLKCSMEAIVGGDALREEISAASILAKTARDAAMRRLDAIYPAYGFAGHKGYGTAAHREALGSNGPCPIHRRSFAPVRACLERAT
jgi:ribonuclease HII